MGRDTIVHFLGVSDGRRDQVAGGAGAGVTSCPHKVIMLQTTKVTNRKCRWHKWFPAGGNVKSMRASFCGVFAVYCCSSQQRCRNSCSSNVIAHKN